MIFQKCRRSWRWIPGTLLGLLTVAVALAPALAVETPGGKTGPPDAFPARGLFSFEEGTIEAWVSFQFDPAAVTEKYISRGQLFQFQVPIASNDLGAGMSVFFCSLPSSLKGDALASRTYLRAGFALDGADVPHPILADCSSWKRGEWHHVAVSWREGKQMEIRFDGQEVVQRGEKAMVEFPQSITRDVPDGSRMAVGTPLPGAKQPENSLVIDEFRLSSIFRGRGSLGFAQAPLQPDPFTMLLENFDEARQYADGPTTWITPQVVAISPAKGPDAAPMGMAVPAGTLVPGKFGLALTAAKSHEKN